MKITVIAVGKLKEKYLKEGIREYTKRLSRFCKLVIEEVNDEPASEKLSHAQECQVKDREAQNILRKIKGGSVVVALDVKGQKMSSEGFASMLNSRMLSGQSDITFVIGGSLGFGEEVLKSSDVKLSLSDMTFPHQLTRLILLEQVYRAFKIINGEVYHK